jgi:hypothetical protein
MTPQIGGQDLEKKQTTKHYTGSQTPKKFLICCSVTVRVQR